MVVWSTFVAEAPDLAKVAEDRFEQNGLVMLGTLRRTGYPRISPTEFMIVGDQFTFGGMWLSMKALDLRRDPRCVIHSTTVDKDGKDGDVKMYGRALESFDADEREAHAQVCFEKIGWRPEGDEWHLFNLDIEEVGYTRFGDGKQWVQTWRPGGPPSPLVDRRAP
jgi:hypothetical protein